jgi:predicted O-linked N-acetylglucosamine transferase (SPINDLY family)
MADICVKDPSRYTEAVHYCRKAVEAAPGNLDFLFNLGRSLIRVGRVREGIELVREVADSAPDNFVANSALLWFQQYLPDLDKRTFFDRYRRLMRISAPMSMARQSHDNDPDPGRRLRVGYISPDFRTHSVAHVFEPFLDSHDRREVETYGYGYVAAPDKITECFREKFDHYREIRRRNPEEIAHLIEQDKVDILVALGGHSRDNCLAALAYKPAPIQVDYGGVNTTGMEQVDYRFTDSIIDPPHLRQFYVEESVCLPGGVHWYRPPQDSPLVGPLPAQRNGYITFSCFNNHIKITEQIMSPWVQILKANRGSRLILKFVAGHDEQIRHYHLDQFERLGIGCERVDVCGTAPSHFEHLELFNEVDIALDPYPFNGCITTMEGLWMGVPVVSLVGENLVSRVGLSILSRVGLDIFAASTGAEYVAKANAFAAQLEDLAQIRASLRQRMLTSDLCDSTRVVREVETAYRRMWYRWCRSKGVDVPVDEGGLSHEVTVPAPDNSDMGNLNSAAK